MALAESDNLTEVIPEGCWKCNSCHPSQAIQPLRNFSINKKTGKPRRECRACSARRRREYTRRMMANPETAELYRARQKASFQKWKQKPENRNSKKQYEKWYWENLPEEKKKKYNESAKRYRQNNREKIQKYNKKAWAALKANPQKHAELLEKRRMQYRLDKMRAGQPIRYTAARKPAKEKMVRVDAKPFRNWLVTAMKEENLTNREVAALIGVDESRIRDITFGLYPNVTLVMADKLLTALDGPPLRSLYPDA